MIEYLKKFENHTAYVAFTGTTAFTRPNVSYCIEENEVHYNAILPPPETRVVAKFNVTDTSNPTRIASATTGFDSIEIDGVEQQSVTTGCTFNTTGEHTVKYTLASATTIGDSAFTHCSNLTNIYIPSNVTNIGNSALEFCSGLTSIDIPSGVTSIGNRAFGSCFGLTNIVIPNSVTSLGYMALFNCSGLTSVTISSGITIIDYSVFCNCSNLTSIVLPNSVTSIGDSAFDNCVGLANIEFPSGLTSIGDDAFSCCHSLTSINLPNSVMSIGNQTFYECLSLTSINIPSSLTSIGHHAFTDCSGLTSIISNAMTAPTIDSYTFYLVGTNGTLYVPQGSTGYDVWMGTGDYYLGKYNWTIVQPADTRVVAKFNVTSTSNPTRILSNISYTDTVYIDDVELQNVPTGYTFSTTGEHTVKYLLDDQTYLGTAFSGCTNLTSIDIPNSVTSIEISTFQGCSGLTSCTIGSGVTSIGNSAFTDCYNLESIVIPNSVITIGNNAFSGCGLTSCTIGSGVTSIGDSAFRNCSSLTSIVSNTTTAPTIQSSTFNGVHTNGVLTVPQGSNGYDVWMQNTSYYLGYYNWTIVQPVETRVVAKFNITNTSASTYIVYEDSYFSSIEIDGVVQPSVERTYTFSTTGEHTVKYTLTSTTIGQDCFSDCTAMTSVVIPDNVTSIGLMAFVDCYGLSSVTIGSGVTTINDEAFNGCSALTSIVIPSSVTSIGSDAFINCDSLSSITVDSSNSVFDSRNNCNALIDTNTNTLLVGCKNTVIPNTVTTIGDDAFQSCRTLISISIPSSVEYIGGYAFNNCSGLTSITCNRMSAPVLTSTVFQNNLGLNGILYIPQGSTGYDIWMNNHYLGKYNWTKVEQ